MDKQEKEQKILQEFGKNLMQIRLSKNLNLLQLSELANMAVLEITELERGQRNPDLPTIYDLAKALEVDPRDLFP